MKKRIKKIKKHKQLEMKGLKGWGGKRKGAGRKNRTQTVNHMKRAEVNFKKPLHITMRLRDDLPKLQNSLMFNHFKKSLTKAKAAGLRVIHFSLQSNHIHLLVECADNETLSRGMKSLGASFGKAIRKVAGGVGAVFKGRFHLHILKSPTEARNGLAYVLLNQAKHEKLIAYVDRYSSGNHFDEWKLLLGRKVGPILEDIKALGRELPEYLSEPKSWLMREGWRKARA